MLQYICDRCGKTTDNETSKKNYATYEIRKRILQKSSGGFVLESPLDLCPDCYKSFSKWLKECKAESENKYGKK